MNKDQIEGRVQETKGKIKEAVGRRFGKPDLEDRGTVEKVTGEVQRTYGDTKENLKESVKEAVKKPE